MFRKKPPQLTTLEELRENYDDVVNLTLKNIMYEEQDRLEDALKGWKSLHTSLLFKIELFEKNLYKMSPEEADIFMELKSIRDQNVKHLIRVQLKLDATTKSRPVNKSSPQSNMTVPSLRNGMKNFHNPPKKKMVQSLRQNSGSGSSVSHGQKHQANLAANLSWQRPKKDELWGDFDQDFEIKDWEKIDDDGFVSDPEPDQEINLIDLDDNHVNKSLENLTLKPKNLYSSISNPNLSEKSEKSSRPLKKEKEKRSNGSLSPDNTYLRPPANKVSSSSDNSPNNSFKDKKYVYKQPQPMNINKLMKQTKKVHLTPQLHTTTTNGGGNNNIHSTNNSNQHKKPVKKSNIQYNYVPAKKPVKKDKNDQRKKDKSISPEPVSDISDEDNVTYVDPLLNPKVQDEIIKLIRGIDYNSGKQILNDIIVHGDEVYWDDIVGLDQAKSSLKEAVVYPFLRPDLFKGLREPIRGMLLFGPPGTGKTMLARAVATESKSTFFSITSSTITSKYLGESEKLVKAMFLLAKKLSPSIVFIDEIDSLLGSRTEGEIESIRRIKNEFLIQWSELSSSTAKEKDELDNQVLILGATNLPWSIDEAARRRFVKKQYIPLPEDDTRKSQILKLLKYQKNEISDDDFKQIIELTKKFSGSDITSLCKDSAMGPLRSLGELLLSTPTEEIRPVNLEDFKNSLKYIKPSVSEDSLKKYEEWSIKFGSGI